VAALTAKAQTQGLSAEQNARRVLEQDIQTVSRRRHISEVIRDNMRDVPPEDLAALWRNSRKTGAASSAPPE